MLLKEYNFLVSSVQNANFICETIISGNRVSSLDANNGLMAFNIIAPVNSMILHITPNLPDVNLSWGNSQAILQGTPSLSPQSWTDLAGPGVTNSVQPALTNQLYRPVQRF